MFFSLDSGSEQGVQISPMEIKVMLQMFVMQVAKGCYAVLTLFFSIAAILLQGFKLYTMHWIKMISVVVVHLSY